MQIAAELTTYSPDLKAHHKPGIKKAGPHLAHCTLVYHNPSACSKSPQPPRAESKNDEQPPEIMVRLLARLITVAIAIMAVSADAASAEHGGTLRSSGSQKQELVS